jgi:hypothetical protein
MDKNIEKKNKILALILALIALISVAGAIIWFNMYAPLILN